MGIDEQLTVDVEFLCDCPCQKQVQKKSDFCNKKGNLVCGLCECDEENSGERCECTGIVEAGSDMKCRMDNTTDLVCSGKGLCICEQCFCDKSDIPGQVFSGKFCECDNQSCDKVEGLLCSGESQGTCNCGQCDCKEPWIGPTCSCRNSTDTCIAEGSTEICSGHGPCDCGNCKCDGNQDGKYSGKFCENAPKGLGVCKEFRDCVDCLMARENCKSNCSHVEIKIVDKFDGKFFD